MSWLTFTIYLVVFCWLITKIPFFKRSGLSNIVLCIFFIVKVAAGIAYFQFYSLPANKPTSDTWKFYNKSIPETDLLLTHPVQFGKEFFQTNNENTGGLFSDQNSYWNDVKDEFMVKLMAIFNVFTGKNYYANIIWFNFLFFFGLIAFYKLVSSVYQVKSLIIAASIFLVPSFLFWCSGIHKDGLIFSALGLVFYSFQQILTRQKILLGLLMICISLALIFFLRNYIVFVLIPCLLIGYLLHLFPKKKIFVLSVSILLGVIIMFTGKYIHPSLNIPGYIVQKQAQFKKLQGGSAIQTPELEDNFSSFAKSLPSAIDMAFFRPHATEKGIAAKIASIEIILFWVAILFCLAKAKITLSQPAVILACWFFGTATLLIIGFTVNFSGAVVRYRSLVLPLLCAPVIGYYLSQANIRKKYM